jgi:hypothetical protein
MVTGRVWPDLLATRYRILHPVPRLPPGPTATPSARTTIVDGYRDLRLTSAVQHHDSVQGYCRSGVEKIGTWMVPLIQPSGTNHRRLRANDSITQRNKGDNRPAKVAAVVYGENFFFTAQTRLLTVNSTEFPPQPAPASGTATSSGRSSPALKPSTPTRSPGTPENGSGSQPGVSRCSRWTGPAPPAGSGSWSNRPGSSTTERPAPRPRPARSRLRGGRPLSASRLRSSGERNCSKPPLGTQGSGSV